MGPREQERCCCGDIRAGGIRAKKVRQGRDFQVRRCARDRRQDLERENSRFPDRSGRSSWRSKPICSSASIDQRRKSRQLQPSLERFLLQRSLSIRAVCCCVVSSVKPVRTTSETKSYGKNCGARHNKIRESPLHGRRAGGIQPWPDQRLF